MRPSPSVPTALSHLLAELFGSLLVVGSTFALIAAVVLVGGGTGGGAGDRLMGLTLAAVALPLFAFGRYLITQHAVSSRRWDDGGGPPRAPAPPSAPPPPGGQSLREKHVAAGRSPLATTTHPRRKAADRRPAPH